MGQEVRDRKGECLNLRKIEEHAELRHIGLPLEPAEGRPHLARVAACRYHYGQRNAGMAARGGVTQPFVNGR